MPDLLRKLFIAFYFAKTRLTHFSDRKKLEAWQQKQFSRFKRNILTHSAFYRPYLDAPFSQWPILNKKMYMENFNQINTGGVDRDAALDIAIQSENDRNFAPKYNKLSVGLSSGTSGNRGLFVASELEEVQWAGTILGKMLPLQLSRHRIAFFLRANNNLYESVRSRMIKFRYFDLIQPIELLAEKLNEFQPTILIAPAQVLKVLALLQGQKLRISPTRIISVAEVLDSNDKCFVESVFKRRVDQVYQCTEGFLGFTCRHGKLHLNEDIVIFEKEWQDEKSGRFVPIITDFRRRTQPIIRYRLDDVLIEDRNKCDCGSCFTVLSAIEGRCDDVLQFPSLKDNTTISIYPDFVRNAIIASSVEIEDYEVVQTGAAALSVSIKPNTEQIRQDITQALQRLFAKFSVVAPEVTFLALTDMSFMQKRRRIRRSAHG